MSFDVVDLRNFYAQKLGSLRGVLSVAVSANALPIRGR